MAESRKEAIAAQHAKAQQGNSAKWYYVDTHKLERMGITSWKPESGDNIIRVIAQQDVNGFFLHEVYLHYKIGADGNNVVCSQKMSGTPCPICELRAEFLAEDPEDKKADALRYSTRYLCFMVDTSSEESIKKGLRWFDAPGAFKRNVLELSKNPRSGEFIDVSDPDEGGDILFVREGKMLQTKYLGFRILPDSTPLSPEIYLATPQKFEDVMIVPDYDETLALVSGQKFTSPVEEKSRGTAGVVDNTPTAASSAQKTAAEPEKKEEEIPFHEDPPKQEVLEPLPPNPDMSNLSVKERIDVLKKQRAEQGGG